MKRETYILCKMLTFWHRFAQTMSGMSLKFVEVVYFLKGTFIFVKTSVFLAFNVLITELTKVSLICKLFRNDCE